MKDRKMDRREGVSQARGAEERGVGNEEGAHLPRSVETFSNWLSAAPALADRKASSSSVSCTGETKCTG